MSFSIDPELIEAWLRGRSVSRGLPQPVPDSGGLRVDSGLPNETRRYLFARPVNGLRELGELICEPRIPLKLCDTPNILRSYLPARWQIFPQNFVMICHEPCSVAAPTPRPPEGYQLKLRTESFVTEACILSAAGELAASGYAAHYGDTFVYDRILTAENHRRKGLGTAVMAALASARPASTRRQVLVATPQGRDLYLSLGWTDYAPYTSAAIPDSRFERFRGRLPPDFKFDRDEANAR